ncbi:autotransporter outer membrane beta-barrel domain-containing protein, partial [Poseidonibacter sp.]|uniref:autotransporter family protein n=1 Tax=Poseidonibacter sp. TaxID=2321188 RepID=UPI003C76D9B6
GNAVEIVGESSNGTSITNSGEISINNNSSSTVFKLKNSNTEKTVIRNSGKIESKVNGAFSDEGKLVNDFANVHIINETSGILSGNVYGSNIDITNSGKFNSPIVSYQSRIGDYIQESTGTLGISVFNTNKDDITHSIIKANNITIKDGSTIDVSILSSNEAQNFLANEILDNVLISNNLIIDVSKVNITDNSALLKFEAIKDGDNLDLRISEAKTIFDATNPNDKNSSDAAKILDTLKENGNNLGGFISALNTKTTDKEVAQAVKETTPIVSVSLANSSNQVQQTIGSVISGRQLGIRNISSLSSPTGGNSGDSLATSYSTWSKAFGTKTKQDDKDGFDGYKFNSYGVALGADKEFGESKRFGLAFVYAKGDLDTNNIEQSSDLNIYNLVAYGSTPILDNDTIFFYQSSLGIQDRKTSRKETTTNTTALANFNGKIASVSGRIIRNIKINDNLLISPTFKAMYSYMNNPSYKESGADSLNLSVEKFSSENLKVGFGTDLQYSFKEGYTLLSNIMINYDLKQSNNTSISSYEANSNLSFATKGMINDKLSYDVGLGVQKEYHDSINLRLEYNYEGRDSTYSNQTISAKISWNF